MKLSIIIVNYCKYKLTERCVESVIQTVKNINYEIIIVDNNSPNESYGKLKEKYKQYNYVKIIKNTNNIGFGAANNIGVNNSCGDCILLLNPDVVALKNSIEKMYQRLIGDKNIGLIGCKLLNQNLTLQYSCRRFMKIKQFIFARTPIKKVLSSKYINKLNSKYLMKDFKHDKEFYVDWVMGSCMMITKEMFNKVGGFSKEYFMYFEDVDLCYKINQTGKKVLYYPQTEMIHIHNQESTKKINKLTFVHLNSMIKFYSKFNWQKLNNNN